MEVKTFFSETGIFANVSRHETTQDIKGYVETRLRRCKVFETETVPRYRYQDTL